MSDASWFRRWNLPGWRGYALAAAMTVVGGIARVALEPWTGNSIPYALFVPAMVVVPFLAGLRPTLVAFGIMLLFGWFIILDGAPITEKVISSLVSLVAAAIISGAMIGLRVLLLELASARDEADRLRGVAEAERSTAFAERDRSDLLVRELNHRVKNLFAVVGSIVALSGRSAPQAKETVGKIRDRVNALAISHTVSQGQLKTESVPMKRIVEVTLAPYDRGNGNVVIEGPDAMLPFEAVTPIGLTLHELATNAAKYGSLSKRDGTVGARWTVSDEGNVRFTWIEEGGPPVAGEPEANGFGSLLLRQAEAQLGASVVRDWSPTGFRMTFEFPLRRSKPRQTT